MIKFIFGPHTLKISSLKWLPGFTNFFLIVAQIYQSLPNYGDHNMYMVYTDNFFINIKLFKYLKKYGLGACNIAKTCSIFLVKLLIFCDILSKKNSWSFL